MFKPITHFAHVLYVKDGLHSSHLIEPKSALHNTSSRVTSLLKLVLGIDLHLNKMLIHSSSPDLLRFSYFIFIIDHSSGIANYLFTNKWKYYVFMSDEFCDLILVCIFVCKFSFRLIDLTLLV